MTILSTKKKSMKGKENRLDLSYVAILFAAIALSALALVGIATRGTTPLVVIPPILLGIYSILRLEK